MNFCKKIFCCVCILSLLSGYVPMRANHDNKDRKERNQFVDLILQSVGYKVIHTKYVMPDVLDLV